MHRKLATLLRLMQGQRRLYLGAILAMAIATLLLYLPPLIIRGAIDGIVRAQPSAWPPYLTFFKTPGPNLAVAATAIVLITLLGGLFTYLRGRWIATSSESIAKRLREHLYSHLQHLPATYHDQAKTGDLVQRCTSDVETLRLFYASQLIEIARAILLVVTVFPIMMHYDRPLALIGVSVLPIIILFSLIFFRRVQSSFKATDEAEGAMTAQLQENLTGIRVVRAFARQQFEIDRFAKKNATHRDRHYKLFVIMALYWSSSDFLCFTQTALILFAGAYRVSTDKISVGTLIAFFAYAQTYIWPVRQMGRVLTELGKSMVSLQRIQEILDSPEEPPAPAPLSESPRIAIRGHIQIKNLSFSHAAKQVLHNINLDIPAGKTLALLGPSGSGKSTLINLLLRLYDYTEGSITLDGIELNTLDRKHLRSQFSVVMQEPFLYSKSLRDNIKLGRPLAEDPDMLEAAKMSSIHTSIEGFPDQYNTLVGERGVTLSGGQRQRVAIARALLKDAPILILDDALSAVDTHTETTILDALKSRHGKHTTLLIAHRLSTLMHADQIAVLEHGRIVQLGTHAELSSQPGLYQRLWQIQGALEEDLDRELANEDPQPAAEAATER